MKRPDMFSVWNEAAGKHPTFAGAAKVGWDAVNERAWRTERRLHDVLATIEQSREWLERFADVEVAPDGHRSVNPAASILAELSHPENPKEFRS